MAFSVLSYIGENEINLLLDFCSFLFSFVDVLINHLYIFRGYSFEDAVSVVFSLSILSIVIQDWFCCFFIRMMKFMVTRDLNHSQKISCFKLTTIA